MRIDLTGQVAIVTGAGGSIGRAACLRLTEAGAAVLAVDLDEAEAEATATLAGSAARAARADVSRSEEVVAYVKLALDTFGHIDILINNAGRQGPVAPLVECPDEAFDEVMAVNARSVFLGMKHVLPHMMTRKSGAIVNTASFAAFSGVRGLGPYVASKHAVLGLTRTAALEAARHGIRVNAVCPGPVDSQLLAAIEAGQGGGDTAALRRRREAAIPQGRYGTADEVADLIVFLVSGRASHIVGQGIHINGGAFG